MDGLHSGDILGQLIHSAADGIGNNGADGKAEGDDKEPPLGTESEVAGGWLVALGEGFEDYKNDFGSESLDFGAYILFS